MIPNLEVSGDCHTIGLKMGKKKREGSASTVAFISSGIVMRVTLVGVARWGSVEKRRKGKWISYFHISVTFNLSNLLT